MPRFVTTRPPSFPQVPLNELLPVWADATRWQVLCGDAGHWRLGVYSPSATSAAACAELELHECPELFLLVSGRLILVLADGQGGTREVPLEAGRPNLAEAPHNGYCPDGPHTGTALVIERDSFDTEYREPGAWR